MPFFSLLSLDITVSFITIIAILYLLSLYVAVMLDNFTIAVMTFTYVCGCNVNAIIFFLFLFFILLTTGQ